MHEEGTLKRGEIYYANLSPVVGSEQGGTRPVLIIQNNMGNRYSSTVIVAPITACMEKSPLPTHIYLNKGLLNRESEILLEQLKTIDCSRLEGYVGNLDPGIMKMVNKAIAVSVGLSQ